MKKILIMVVALIALSFSHAMAAGTITGSSEYNGENNMIITYTITFDASAASFNDVPLDHIIKTRGAAELQTIFGGGWYLHKIESFYVATVVTADCDLYLWSYKADGLDILGGNGVDKVDADTNFTIYPATSSQPLTGRELIDIDNNAVNSASHLLRLHLYR